LESRFGKPGQYVPTPQAELGGSSETASETGSKLAFAVRTAVWAFRCDAPTLILALLIAVSEAGTDNFVAAVVADQHEFLFPAAAVLHVSAHWPTLNE
jgi:hypothetical protein